MDYSLAKNLDMLRQAGVSDRYMPRLVRAVRALDRAAAQLEASPALPAWKVFIMADGQSTSTTICATTADQAKREAVRLGYNVTGLVVAVK